MKEYKNLINKDIISNIPLEILNKIINYLGDSIIQLKLTSSKFYNTIKLYQVEFYVHKRDDLIHIKFIINDYYKAKEIMNKLAYLYYIRHNEKEDDKYENDYIKKIKNIIKKDKESNFKYYLLNIDKYRIHQVFVKSDTIKTKNILDNNNIIPYDIGRIVMNIKNDFIEFRLSMVTDITLNDYKIIGKQNLTDDDDFEEWYGYLNINEIKNIKDIKKDNIKITYNHKDIINLIEDDFKKNYEQSYKYNKKLDNNSYQILCFFVIRKVGVIPKWFTKMYISNINYCIYKM